MNSVYELPHDKELTQIDIVYDSGGLAINNLILTYGDGTTKQLGQSSNQGTRDSYKFAKGEVLIGAEIEHGSYSFVRAVTFHTLKRV